MNEQSPAGPARGAGTAGWQPRQGRGEVVVDDRTLRVLEFDKIRQRLAEAVTYPPARELALALTPSTDPDEVMLRQAETAEAAGFLAAGIDIHLGHLADIRPHLRRARAGGVLEEPELAEVAHTLAAARALRHAIARSERTGALADAVRHELPDLSSLEHAVLSRLTDEGQLRDDASPELLSIRRQLRNAQMRLRADLEEWVRRAVQQGLLQEATYTVRGGRFVLPVRSDRRDRVPGIVHDRSASGQTLFIEPLELVEGGNRIRELEAQEEAERQRILTQLSRRVQEREPEIARAVAVLARLDFAAARARLGERYGASFPEPAWDGRLVLQGARHPLLIEEHFAGRLERVVPLDVSCGPDVRVLLITGPNTGGKTVALKTVGLLALMFQSGLPVPAGAGTALPVFRGVFADIGDEQSIEQSLSTFSSHMSHIVSIIERAGPGSLVLLDELGAGTDPHEGAALAAAILEHLADRGCTTLATTHYGQLKSFVHVRPGMVNASMEFDPDTLSPTYRLRMGLPGRSNALEIARRLGLSPEILAAAERYVGTQRAEFERLLAEVETQRRLAAEEARRAEAARQEAEALRQRLDEARRELEEQRREILQEARREAREVLREARREAEAWIGRLRRLGREAELEESRRARAALEAREAALAAAEAEAREKEREAFVPGAGAGRGRAGAGAVEPGARVHIVPLNQEGEVVEGPNAAGEVTVQVGPMRMVVAVRDVEVRAAAKAGGGAGGGGTPGRGFGGAPREGDAARRGSRADGGPGSAAAAAHASQEIHLRGLTVDEALYELERFLDRSRLAGLDRVRIVHGKGTGALRQAVAAYLAELPFVRDFYLAPAQEGGHGVTIVELD